MVAQLYVRCTDGPVLKYDRGSGTDWWRVLATHLIGEEICYGICRKLISQLTVKNSVTTNYCYKILLVNSFTAKDAFEVFREVTLTAKDGVFRGADRSNACASRV